MPPENSDLKEPASEYSISIDGQYVPAELVSNKLEAANGRKVWGALISVDADKVPAPVKFGKEQNGENESVVGVVSLKALPQENGKPFLVFRDDFQVEIKTSFGRKFSYKSLTGSIERHWDRKTSVCFVYNQAGQVIAITSPVIKKARPYVDANGIKRIQSAVKKALADLDG